MLRSHILIPASMLVLAVSLGERPGMPQEENIEYPPNTIFRSDVVHVPVDAVVRDRNGAYIDKLKADDFIIYDNGVAQTVTMVSQNEVPLDIALIVDNSKSIKPYVLQLQNSAMTVLQKLNPDTDRIALFSLGTFPIQLSGLTSDLPMIKDVIGIIPRMNTTNIGRTNIRDALCHAARYLKAKSRIHRRAIILISDNEEIANWVEHSMEEVRVELLESNVVLYSIKTEGNSLNYGDKKLVGQYVKETGGEIVNVQSEHHLSAALDAVIASMKHSYLLGFDPPGISQKKPYHKIAVKIRPSAHCKGCRVQARKGYYIGTQTVDSSSAAIKPPTASQRLSNPANKSLAGEEFPQSFFMPSSISYEAFAPMMYKFWSSGMLGHGNSLFEKYVHAFKEASNSDPGIQLMLTRYFLSKYGGKRNSKSANKTAAINEMMAFYQALKCYTNPAFNETERSYKCLSNMYKYIHSDLIPPEPLPQESIRYSLQAQGLPFGDSKGEIRLEIHVDSAPLYFYYMEEQHKCLLVFLFEFQNRSETICRSLELSFPEGKFRNILQSGMPISVKVPILPTDAGIKLTIFDPFSFTYGVQSIQIPG